MIPVLPRHLGLDLLAQEDILDDLRSELSCVFGSVKISGTDFKT